ncbi:MAG TPA: hypothetical protein VNY84_01825, partial [Acidimicrobiales bacterium]|nr:hypothetical protein [Acidimicrobiales bacterium]
SPNPDPASTGITLSGTGVTIQVAAALIGAGVNTGLVSAADSLADLGVAASSTDASGGVNAVTAAAGKVTLNITGSNTTEIMKTASNPSAVNTTFWVTNTNVGSPATGTSTVYSAISTPAASAPNAARTGTVLTGNLSVTVPLGDTTWTPSSGATSVVFAEQNTAPANTTTPSSTDQNAAPLILLPKINGAVSAPFHCWPGTVTGTTTMVLVPGASSPIDTASVGSGTTTTTAGGSTTTTAVGATTTTAVGATTTTAAGASTTSAAGATATTAGAGTANTTAASNTGSRSYAATCLNNVQPGSPSTLTFTLKGTAPSQVTAGSGVTLTDQTWNVAVPGTLLTTAINLGLLSAGQTVDSTVNAAVFASNTTQGTITSTPIPVKFGPVKVDGTGQAADAAVTFAVPNQTWTAVGGTVGFSMAKTIMNITIGALKVTFTCDPGTNLAAFASTAVTGKTAAATQVLGAQLAFTGAKSVVLLTILALILLDLGYLAWSSTVPARRRRSDK